MRHTSRYEKVARWREAGLWTNTMVRNAVVKGWITQAESDGLTGDDSPYEGWDLTENGLAARKLDELRGLAEYYGADAAGTKAEVVAAVLDVVGAE